MEFNLILNRKKKHSNRRLGTMQSNSDDFDDEKIELDKLTQAYSTNRLSVHPRRYILNPKK